MELTHRTRILSSGELSTTQWAAVRTQWGWTREPPQNCVHSPSEFWYNNIACHGQRPSCDIAPPTIRGKGLSGPHLGWAVDKKQNNTLSWSSSHRLYNNIKLSSLDTHTDITNLKLHNCHMHSSLASTRNCNLYSASQIQSKRLMVRKSPPRF